MDYLFGPIPDELLSPNHLCSNRSYVNPHHLEVTDQAGNCRHGKGTKLNLSQVKEIKEAKSNRVWGGAKNWLISSEFLLHSFTTFGTAEPGKKFRPAFPVSAGFWGYMNTVETVHRDDMLKWCWEELTDHVESLEFAALAGNKPVELLNIAAKSKTF